MAKCADCGFLAARLKNERVLVDAEESMRQKWVLPRGINDKGVGIDVYDHDPICFVRVPTFRVEAGVKFEATDAITREHDCGRFEPWQQGFTPKEHAEMVEATKLREWQERRDKADAEERRAREEREDARDKEIRDFQAGQAQIAGDRADRTARQTRGSQLIALLSVLIAASSAAYSIFKAKEPQPPIPVNVTVDYPTRPEPAPPGGVLHAP